MLLLKIGSLCSALLQDIAVVQYAFIGALLDRQGKDILDLFPESKRMFAYVLNKYLFVIFSILFRPP